MVHYQCRSPRRFQQTILSLFLYCNLRTTTRYTTVTLVSGTVHAKISCPLEHYKKLEFLSSLCWLYLRYSDRLGINTLYICTYIDFQRATLFACMFESSWTVQHTLIFRPRSRIKSPWTVGDRDRSSVLNDIPDCIKH